MFYSLIAYLIFAALIALTTKDADVDLNGVKIHWAVRSIIGPFALMFVGLVILLIGAILLFIGSILASPVLLYFIHF